MVRPMHFRRIRQRERLMPKLGDDRINHVEHRLGGTEAGRDRQVAEFHRQRQRIQPLAMAGAAFVRGLFVDPGAFLAGLLVVEALDGEPGAVALLAPAARADVVGRIVANHRLGLGDRGVGVRIRRVVHHRAHEPGGDVRCAHLRGCAPLGARDDGGLVGVGGGADGAVC